MPATATQTVKVSKFIFAYQGTEAPAPCPRCAERIRTNPKDKDLVCPHRANKQKSRFLKSAIAKMLKGALPTEFQPRKYSRLVTQQELAASAGASRAHYTKGLTQVANPDDSWTADRRQVQSSLLRDALRIRRLNAVLDIFSADPLTAAKLLILRACERPSDGPREPLRPIPTNLIHRRRGFHEPDSYAWANLPERSHEWLVIERYRHPDGNERLRAVRSGFMLREAARKYAEEQNKKFATTRFECKPRPLPKHEYHAPTPEVLFERDREDAYVHQVAPLFDERLASLGSGFWEQAAMFAHQALTNKVGGDAMLALVAYCAVGMLGEMSGDEAHRANELRRQRAKEQGKEDPGKLYEGGDLRDRVYVHQDVIARMTGLNLKGVYRANCRLEKLGIIQVDGRRGAVATIDPLTGVKQWKSECQCVIFRPLEGEYRERARLRRERRRLLNKVKQHLRDVEQQRAVLRLYDDLRHDEQLRNADRVAFYQAFRSSVLKLHVADAIASDFLYCPPRPP